jgi:acylglycerol lipase
MVVEDQFVFRSSDGVPHPVRRWSGPQLIPDRGTLICLHGIQSHSGWYRWSSTQLARAGWGVNFPDRRGSGRSEERRGDAPSAERLLADVVEFAREIQEVDAPCVLLGLSWGARLAAILAARHPEVFQRLVLLYPGIHTRVGPTLWQRQALRIATRLGAGLKTVAIPLVDPALFTRDVGGQEFIRSDFLALHELTLRFLAASETLRAEADRVAETISVPTVVFLAENDRIVDNEGARAWYHRVPVVHKELVTVPGAEHTFDFDPQREWFIDRLIAWLNHGSTAALPEPSGVAEPVDRKGEADS